MYIRILSTTFLFWGFIFQASSSLSQGYPQIRIDPWTTKAGEKSTYYEMLNWDTSPYREFTYIKRTGPNKWDITEYMNFRMLFPRGYEQPNDKDKYPMVILLHGAGESGVAWSDHFDYVNGHKSTPPEPEKIDNNDHQLKYGGKEFFKARNLPDGNPGAFNGFFVFPQIPYNGSWAASFNAPISKYNRQVLELVELLTNEYNIDPDRVYVMGLSNGARGVWDLVNRRPDLFAAGIIFSGLGSLDHMPRNLAHFPLWIFQGGEDNMPAPNGTYQMINALESEGGSPRLTLYENLGHNVWDRAFAEPDFFSWLGSKTKLSVHTYYGSSHFNTLDNINAKLGISPGFDQYQWKYNGEVIEDSDDNNIVISRPGAYQVRFKRKGEWTSWSTAVFISSDEDLPELPYIYRLNLGGKEIEDDPISWEEDSDSHPISFLLNAHGSTVVEADDSPIQNHTEAPSTIFKTGRIVNDSIYYRLPVQGEVQVIFYFADLSENENAGMLNIAIEGNTVASDLNIKDEAGGETGKKSYWVFVTDNILDIALKQMEGSPTLTGIEVRGNATITGTHKIKDELITVFPNPFTNHLEVALPYNTSNMADIFIYNIKGEILFQEKKQFNENLILTTKDIPIIYPGLYYLKVRLKNGPTQVFKIVKGTH